MLILPPSAAAFFDADFHMLMPFDAAADADAR